MAYQAPKNRILNIPSNPAQAAQPITLSPDVKVAKLQLQLDKANAQMQAYGKNPQKGRSPSIISRVFDVLSRGDFASAGAMLGTSPSRLLSFHPSDWGKEISSEASGAWKGITGQQKKTYSDVLAKAGVKNKAALAVGGLVGDIALDPTTYLGSGLVKEGSALEHAAQETNATGKALKAATESGNLDKVAKDARLAYLNEIIKNGTEGKSASKIVGESEKVGNAAKLQEAERIGAEAKNTVPAAQKGAVQLKFMGQPVAQSELAYKALTAIPQALGKTETGAGLASLFSNASRLGPLAQAKKVFEGRKVSELNDWITQHGWNKLPLTKDEATAFSHAYEHGLVDSLPETSSKGVNYKELENQVKQANHELYLHDTASVNPNNLAGPGLIDPTKTPEAENYLYHSYPGNTGGSFKSSRVKAIASDVFKPGLEQKIPTLQDAIDMGLKPETDIRKIMMNRGAKSFSGTARANYIQEAVDKFGMTLDKSTKDLMKKQGHDLVNVKSELAKGIKPEDRDKMLQFLGDNVYMPRSIAKDLGAADKVYQTPDEFVKFRDLFDNLQRRWKAGATVYNPGHHVRMIANTAFSNFLDGVDTIKPYEQARKAIFGGEKSIAESTKVGGQLVHNTDLLREFKESGAAPGFALTHVDEGPQILKKIPNALHEATQKREEFMRFAHWVDALGKEAKSGGLDLSKLQDLKTASGKAADRVRHWNVDFTDLTPFERTFMKRAMPFYTHMRNFTPLMMEAAFTRPGRVAVLPKGMNALQKLIGLNPQDTLPVNSIPKWLTANDAFQIGHSGQNPVFESPTLNPFTAAQLFEGGTKGILSEQAAQLSPILRALPELAMGRTFYGGGIPIKSTSSYLINEVPFTKNLSAVDTGLKDVSKNDTRTRLLNYLTGMGLQEATPNRIKGELHRQLDQRKAYLQKARKSGGG